MEEDVTRPGISRREFDMHQHSVDWRFRTIEEAFQRVEKTLLARIEQFEGRLAAMIRLLVVNLAGIIVALLLLWLRA